MQLLELENAFEGNQYVIGSERKALAKTLNLTETQVNIRNNYSFLLFFIEVLLFGSIKWSVVSGHKEICFDLFRTFCEHLIFNGL